MGYTFLLVSAQYLPTSGGVERYTYNLGRRLMQDGHRIYILTSALPGLPEHELEDGMEIYRFPSVPFMSGRLPLLKPCPAFFRLARTLWAQKIDYCLINTYFYPLSMYAAHCTKKRHIPTILVNHGSAWLMTGSKPLVLAGQLYEQIAARLCHHYVPAFYGVSQAAAQWLTHFSIQAKGTVTNAICPEDVQKTVSGKNWRQTLHLPAEAPIIAFVGRMIPEKGVLPLLDAISEIRAAHPAAQLVMAGSGPLYTQFQQSPPEGVTLLGSQAYPDVLALLTQADVFCLPSRSEGFACTVLEAAALGCPILTTPTGDSPQLLPDASYGILLKDQSPQAITQACIYALSNPDWCKTASERTLRRLEENYTWENSTAQLYQAFDLS